MEDSIELSDNQHQNQGNILVSPENYKLQKCKFGSNTASQQSLAYSNSTLQKDYLHERSPHINVHNFEPPQFKISSETRIRKSSKDHDGSIFQRKQMKIQVEPPSDQMERKTIQKAELTKLSRKNKQLQNSLQLETIVSEELRAKVSVLTEMLDNKAKDLGLFDLLKVKNSSKDMKNIDIFVEMKYMRKTINQKDVQIQKLKTQINQMTNELQSLKERKHNEDSLSRSNKSDAVDIRQLQQLRQEKQSLFNYIQQLKQQSQERQQHTAELENQIERMLQKYKLIEQQRPKLINQIVQRTKSNKQLEQENNELRMTNNLIEIKNQELIAQLKAEISEFQIKLNQKSVKEEKSVKEKKSVKEAMSQTVGAHQNQIIMSELNLLKTERDHYLREYRKKLQQSSQLYELRLKMSKYQK